MMLKDLFAASVALAALCAGPVLAESDASIPPKIGPFGEPHLPVIARTKSEAARIAVVTAPPSDFTKPEAFEAKPAGAATVRARATAEAFSQPSELLSFEQELSFKLGNGLFKKLWVSSPSSTLASDGLGPLYNARSCQRCHLKDGRGHTPESREDSRVSLFLRISVPAPADAPLSELEAYLADLGHPVERTRPEPTYGGQIQDFAIQGHAAEARMEVSYTEQPVALSGGESASLRVPHYGLSALGYGPLAPDALLSPRVAPQMIGLGLLEAIPEADILALADPEDSDGNGISGRAQAVWSIRHDQPMLGRFGWKAGNATIEEQSAGAFAGDIGISSPLVDHPEGDCSARQRSCLEARHGDGDARGQEIDATGLALVRFYSANLGVPARRDLDDPQVLRGKQVFHDTGCAACHHPKFVTHRLDAQPEQSFQLIWPYTDLLLHDMGKGLADGRPEGRASGREWKTPPLWGIGLTRTVSGHTQFLHDGRARSLLEAVLWHGGEADRQRDAVVTMPAEDRAALIRFLESL